jgi:hypothetical protein
MRSPSPLFPTRAAPPDRDGVVAAMEAAAAGLARLDERLGAAPPAVTEGWSRRMALEEASASARLDGEWSDAEDLLLAEAGVLDGPPGPQLGATLRVLDMVRLAQRRRPRSFWTPGRLARVMDALPGDAAADLTGRGLDQMWRGQVWRGLQRVLAADRIAAWKGRGALLGAADILRAWHDEGLAGLLGATPGRLLAAAWPWRLGTTRILALPVSWGFVGLANGYAPESPDWDRFFLEAAARGSRRGGDLLDRLVRSHARLAEGARGQRSSSRLPLLADLLTRQPAVSTRQAAEALGTSRQGALNLLQELRAAGLVREISGRRSYWVWATTLT